MAYSVDFLVKNGIVVSTTATIQSDVQSTSTNTGALLVTGGAGIGKNLSVGGNTYMDGGLYVQGVEVVAANISTHTGAIGVIGRTGVDGTVYVNNVTIASKDQSISTNTGALHVIGGAGVGQDLYVGGDTHIHGTLYVDGPIVLLSDGTTSTVANSTSTLNGGFNGNTTFLAIDIANVTSSTSVTTGALTVAGGVGVVGSLYASAVYDDGNRALTSIVAGTGTNVTIDGTTATISLSIDDNQPFNVKSTTSATSISTGAFTVAGGAGIGQDLYVGGNIIVDGVVVINSLSGNNGVPSGNSSNITTVPIHSYGISSDTAGMMAFDSSYAYYCTANYVDDATTIWRRIAWSAGTW